jgi:hypothetical protein
MRFHRLMFYRYLVGHKGYRCGLNRYGWSVIGVYVTAGRYAYCIKWANA